MVVRPTAISEIADLELHTFIKFLSSLVGSLFLDLLLHGLRVEHFLVEVQAHLSLERIGTISISRFRSLTLLELLSIEYELFDGLLSLLHVLDIVFVSMRQLDASLLVVHLSFDQLSPLQVRQVLIGQCLRSQIWRWVEDALWKRVGAWHFDVLLEYFIDLTHLLRVQVLEAERLARVFLSAI